MSRLIIGVKLVVNIPLEKQPNVHEGLSVTSILTTHNHI